MRRLIISDLHLGAPRALACHPLAVERLVGELEWADELIIAGDLLALPVSPLEACLRVAAPWLKQVARHVERIRYLPGNHDWHLAAVSLDELAARRVAGAPYEPGRLPAAERILGMLIPDTYLTAHHPVITADGIPIIHGHQIAPHQNALLVGPYDQGLGSLYEAQYALRSNGNLYPEIEAAITDVLMAGKDGKLKPQETMMAAFAQVANTLALPEGDVVVGHAHQVANGVYAPGESRWRFFNAGCWVLDRFLLERDPAPERSWPGNALRLHDGKLEMRQLMADLTRGELEALVAP